MMAYKNNFAVAIKHNGKILRELNDVVNLPFGSDYSVYMKNKNSRKAVVKVEIDGVDVIDGNSIIIEPNSSLELKGFMKGSVVKNRFRFIKKTDRIRKHRGNRIDDGLVRIEYWFEKPPSYTVHPTVYRGPTKSSPTYWGTGNNDIMTCSFACNNSSTFDSFNDDGITVKGSQTRQDFVYGDIGELENHSTVITLKLNGRRKKALKAISQQGRLVKKPVTVKTRLRCTTCGTKSKSVARFCRHCGTFLN